MLDKLTDIEPTPLGQKPRDVAAKDRPGEAQTCPSELVARIEAGDREAENELVLRYRKGLQFVIYRECADHALAEDVAHDTLTKVILNAREGRIRNPAGLASYIRHTGVFHLIDIKRKEARRRTTPCVEAVELAPADTPDIGAALDRKQLGLLVRELLDTMTVDRDRDLLRRFYLYGEDKAALLDEFGVTSAHFDRVKFRALKRLRRLVEDHVRRRRIDPSDLF